MFGSKKQNNRCFPAFRPAPGPSFPLFTAVQAALALRGLDGHPPGRPGSGTMLGAGFFVPFFVWDGIVGLRPPQRVPPSKPEAGQIYRCCIRILWCCSWISGVAHRLNHRLRLPVAHRLAHPRWAWTSPWTTLDKPVDTSCLVAGGLAAPRTYSGGCRCLVCAPCCPDDIYIDFYFFRGRAGGSVLVGGEPGRKLGGSPEGAPWAGEAPAAVVAVFGSFCLTFVRGCPTLLWWMRTTALPSLHDTDRPIRPAASCGGWMKFSLPRSH